MLKENYFHPNGQIPAYEWAFGDVNPPVHALGALTVFRAERVQGGKADSGFLQRVLHKLLMNYTWWINRKDSEGHNVFEGGFLGLDNISVFDRSQPLPSGYSFKQADATGWTAMFALNLTIMALEIATEDPDYEDIAIQTYAQFLAIANTIGGYTGSHVPLWDAEAGFFKDLVVGPDGRHHRIDVYSWVGLIPLFACEIVDQRLLAKAPRFRAMLTTHEGGLFDGHYICACPEAVRGYIHAYRLAEEQANVARHRIRTQSRKNGRTPKEATLFWAGWVLVFTPVAPAMLRAETISALYRVRWQVEIAIRAVFVSVYHTSYVRYAATACSEFCRVNATENRYKRWKSVRCGQVTRERRQPVGRGLVAWEAAVCLGGGTTSASAARG
jgi:hypothetical protein